MVAVESKIICGDALEELKKMPDESIDCCITSPPYWGLRDYGIQGQLGLEKTPEEYVAKMVEVFREVKRVLKKEGTCWLNLGDTYSAARWSSGEGQPMNKMRDTHRAGEYTELRESNLPSKNLVGIPWRVAFTLQSDGWYLRQDIIWAKPNPMPESVTDRCTKSHEYIFLLAKSQKYYFDNEAIKEKSSPNTVCPKNPSKGKKTLANKEEFGVSGNGWADAKVPYRPDFRNKRSVWTITTKPFSGVKITSDYVGRDGRFYKASLDCPIYEHRLLAEKRCRGEYDGLVNFQKPRTSDSENYLFPELVDEYVSIPFHNEDDDKASAKQNEQMLQNISDHKTSENSSDRDLSQSPHHNKDIEQKSVCKNGAFCLDNKEIATLHSKKNHKNTSAKVLSDNASDKISCHKSDKQQSCQVSHLDLPYKKYNIAKCTCQENKVDHFATFPEDLILPCILAGCPKGGITLDPFSGAGTVGVVAKKLGRNFIGIELNPKYVEMAQKRIENTQESLF